MLNFSIQVTAELKHYDKRIIECTWDGKAWKFLRLREDKSFPNALKTAQSKPLVFWVRLQAGIYLLKVNNRNTRQGVKYVQIYFTFCSSVSVVNFEHVIAGWTGFLGIVSLTSIKSLNPLSANPTKWSVTLKQFVGFCWRIVWVCLTILWGWRLKV